MMIPTSLRTYVAAIVLLIAVVMVGGCGDDTPAEKKPGDSATATNGSTTTGSTDTAGISPSDTSPASSPQIADYKQATVVNNPETRYEVRLTPRKGEAYTYKYIRSGELVSDGKKATDLSRYNYTCTITNVNGDGSVAMEIRFDSIYQKKTLPAGVLDSAAPAQSIEYDTRQAPSTKLPGSENLKAMIGKPINVTLARTGEVREISNLEPVISAVLAGKEKQIPDSLRGTAREVVRQQMQLQVVTVIQDMFLQFAPDSTIAPGSTWSRSDTTGAFGIPSTASATYKLVEVRNVGGAPIGMIRVDLSTSFPKRKFDERGVSLNIADISMGGGGELLVDFSTGMPVRKSSRFTGKMKATVTATAGPQKGRSQSQDQSMVNTVVVERTGYTPSQQ